MFLRNDLCYMFFDFRLIKNRPPIEKGNYCGPICLCSCGNDFLTKAEGILKLGQEIW
jgi:hypothetical protein